MAALSVREFNHKMREIISGTKEGKKIIKSIVEEVKNSLQEDEFNEAITEVSSLSTETEDEGFDLEELMGDKHMGDSEDDSEDDSGFEIGELF
jgi:isopropylmalate/homocitrate/citramalate synthase